MNNSVLIAHIESNNLVSGGYTANAEGITYPVFPAPNGKMEDIQKGQFLRCKILKDSLDVSFLEVLDEDAIATEQEWREQEMEYDNPLAKHFTIDINPETLEQMVEDNEDEFDLHAKSIDNYYEDITKEVMAHFNFSNFQTIDDLPFNYVTYEGHYPIERVFKFENEDVKIIDFENEINKHRYQMVFVPKTMAGLDLIDQYIEKIKDRNWLMNIEEQDYLFLETPKSEGFVEII